MQFFAFNITSKQKSVFASSQIPLKLYFGASKSQIRFLARTFMKFKLLSFLIVISIFSISVAAQSGKTPEAKPTPAKASADESITVKTKVTKADYEDLLAKLKKGDTSINFAKMRLAYTETKDYKPYGGGELRGEMYEAYQKDGFQKAVDTASKILETNYVDIAAHFVSWKSYEFLGDKAAAERHKKIFDGLWSAIKQNDGLSEKTAMISIGISEQYFVMNLLGFSRQSKALTQKDGSVFDVHTAVNAEKQTRQFYFNIDKVFGRF